MRKVCILIFVSLFFCRCSQNSANEKNINYNVKEFILDSLLNCQEGALLFIETPKYDFGSIKREKTPEINIDVQIENIGTLPLIMLKADVSCGCLSVDYPKEPILPGKKEILQVKIDTKNQNGSFNKTIYLKSNAVNDLEIFRIVGQIK